MYSPSTLRPLSLDFHRLLQITRYAAAHQDEDHQGLHEKED